MHPYSNLLIGHNLQLIQKIPFPRKYDGFSQSMLALDGCDLFVGLLIPRLHQKPEIQHSSNFHFAAVQELFRLLLQFQLNLFLQFLILILLFPKSE